jgi:hypothetical protein
MSAAELLSEVFDRGINIIVDNGSLKCRSSQPLSDELIVRIRTHKAEIIDILQKRLQKQGKPYLKNGELICRGLLPPGTMLDTLLELGATDEIIERYIGPHLTVNSWERWQLIKESRNVH